MTELNMGSSVLKKSEKQRIFLCHQQLVLHMHPDSNIF